jgi:hypothetical protein
MFLVAGRFAAPDIVKGEGKTLRFANAVIAIGGRATELLNPGLRDADTRHK